MFNRQQSDSSIMGYVNANYVGDLDDKRSTTSYVFTLMGRLICWKSMVQSIIVLFITVSEYMMIAEAAKEAL